MGSFVESVAEPFVDAAEDVGDTFTDAAGGLGGVFGDMIEATAGAAYDVADTMVTEVAAPVVETVVAPVAQEVVAPVWETALDGLAFADDITPDIPFVDVSFDDGQIGAGVDIEVIDAGINFGEHGASGHADTLVAGVAAGITDQGYGIGAHYGDVDWPKEIPAVEFGIGGDWHGNVHLEGEAQGSFPLPDGSLISGEAGANFHYNYDDGTWGLGGKTAFDYYSASGTNVGGSAHAQYERTVDGESFEAGGEAHLGIIGGPQIGIGGEYKHVEQGGNEYTSVSGGGTFDGYGVHADGRVGYQSSMVNGVERTSVTGSGGVGAYGVEARGTAQYDEMTTADGRVTSNFRTAGGVSAFGAYVGSDGVDVPFAGGDPSGLAGLARSFPGMDGALGSMDLGGELGGILESSGFDPGASDPGQYLGGLLHTDGLSGGDILDPSDLPDFGTIGDGAPWSMGSWFGSDGPAALYDVMPRLTGQEAWSPVEEFAQESGVDLPSWARDLANTGSLPDAGQYLSDGGMILSALPDDVGLYDLGVPDVPDWYNEPLTPTAHDFWNNPMNWGSSGDLQSDSDASRMWADLRNGEFIDEGDPSFDPSTFGYQGPNDSGGGDESYDEFNNASSSMNMTDDTYAVEPDDSSESGDDYGLDDSTTPDGWDADSSDSTDSDDGYSPTYGADEFSDEESSDDEYDDASYAEPVEEVVEEEAESDYEESAPEASYEESSDEAY